jgi:hypothetical protein
VDQHGKIFDQQQSEIKFLARNLSTWPRSHSRAFLSHSIIAQSHRRNAGKMVNNSAETKKAKAGERKRERRREIEEQEVQRHRKSKKSIFAPNIQHRRARLLMKNSYVLFRCIKSIAVVETLVSSSLAFDSIAS